MEDGFEKIRKNTVMTPSIYHPGTFVEEVRKTAGVQPQTRTKHLPRTSLESYL
jgi:hypothetical protein